MRGWGAVRAGEAAVQTCESDVDALLGEDVAHFRPVLAVVAGLALARRWPGAGPRAPVLSGVVLLLAVTPAQVTDDAVPAVVALSPWSAVLVVLGRAVERPGRAA